MAVVRKMDLVRARGAQGVKLECAGAPGQLAQQDAAHIGTCRHLKCFKSAISTELLNANVFADT